MDTWYPQAAVSTDNSSVSYTDQVSAQQLGQHASAGEIAMQNQAAPGHVLIPSQFIPIGLASPFTSAGTQPLIVTPANALQTQFIALSQPLQQQQQPPLQHSSSDQSQAATPTHTLSSAAQAILHQQMPQLNNLYKTQLCKHYLQTKHCHVGSKCHFAHGENELRKKDDPLPVEVQMKMLNIPYNNFKTQKCKYFFDPETPGQCKFGKNCSYAHGETDLRDPYQNVDLEKLVQEHYGVPGYDPKSAVPQLTAKVNEQNTTGASEQSQTSGAATGGQTGAQQVSGAPNLQKSVSLPVQGQGTQYVMVGKQPQPRFPQGQKTILQSTLPGQSTLQKFDSVPIQHQAMIFHQGQVGQTLIQNQIQSGQLLQHGLISSNGAQHVVLATLPSGGNGMIIQQPQHTIIQYVPVPVPATHIPQAASMPRQQVHQLMRMPMTPQTNTGFQYQAYPQYGPQIIMNHQGHAISNQQQPYLRPTAPANQMQDVSAMLANLQINAANQSPPQNNHGWPAAHQNQDGSCNNNGSGTSALNTSASTTSSNGFNYMLMNPDQYSVDEFEGASADQTSSAAAAMHTTQSILGASIFQ